MAERVRIELVDDYDGSRADETVTFALDGVDYEIDLTSAHASQLREVVRPFAAKARRVGGRRSGGAGEALPATAPAVDVKAVRAWAQAHGHDVSRRGRISRALIDAYQKAVGQVRPAG